MKPLRFFVCRYFIWFAFKNLNRKILIVIVSRKNWGNWAIVNSLRATISKMLQQSLFALLLSRIISLVSRISFRERNYVPDASGIGAITRTLRMHLANVTLSASYRAWRMVTILTTSSWILWPAFGRLWSVPRYRILTHLAKSAPYFGFISAPPHSDFRTRTFRRRAFTNSI